MKRGSHIKYILIGSVGLIWGLIIYKVIPALDSDVLSQTTIINKPLIKLDNDSTYYLINEIYPDPFFKNIEGEEVSYSEENVVQDISDSIIAEMEPPQEEYAPLIKYNGYIYNPATKKRTAIISFEGSTKSVSLNESVDDKIKITFISNQKIGIVYKGKKMEYPIGG